MGRINFAPLFFFCGLQHVVICYLQEALNDKIGILPGSESLNVSFNQFSGYLAVQGRDTKSKNLHYWFVESMNKPATDPLAFWTNGGPGCSGLIAFFTEQGPFRPNRDGSLSLNPYAWNQKSNIVFIESPTGVGFSYTDKVEDLASGDDSTAHDNYNLILTFLERFPEYKTHPVYLTSESYGGHYIPTLAKVIMDHNKSPALNKTTINLKGLAIGNPYTDVYSGTPAMIDTFWGHQLISWPLYNAYKSVCTLSSTSDLCATFEDKAFSSIGNLNPYALDFPVCASKSSQNRAVNEVGDVANYRRGSRDQRLWLLHHIYGHLPESERRALSIPVIQEYEPCEDDWTVKYLANMDVKKAIHVKEDIIWSACSSAIIHPNPVPFLHDSTVQYNYADMNTSTAPLYKYLIDGDHNLDVLVYSGDDDAVCSTLGSQHWIWNLGYAVKSSWQTYFFGDQTAGYLTRFEGIRFAFLTVHGAGHEVPTYQPAIAYDMWAKFIAGYFTDHYNK